MTKVSDIISKESTLHLVLRLRGGMYHETSGRDGTYQTLKSLYFSLDNRDLSEHNIPGTAIKTTDKNYGTIYVYETLSKPIDNDFDDFDDFDDSYDEEDKMMIYES